MKKRDVCTDDPALLDMAVMMEQQESRGGIRSEGSLSFAPVIGSYGTDSGHSARQPTHRIGNYEKVKCERISKYLDF
jgi:hypothetical protein